MREDWLDYEDSSDNEDLDVLIERVNNVKAGYTRNLGGQSTKEQTVSFISSGVRPPELDNQLGCGDAAVRPST
jgi:hypothetical protein